MSKINVANFLFCSLSHKIPNEIGEHEHSLIVSQMIDSWDEKRYLHPVPRYETKQSVNHFSTEYNYGLRKG